MASLSTIPQQHDQKKSSPLNAMANPLSNPLSNNPALSMESSANATAQPATRPFGAVPVQPIPSTSNAPLLRTPLASESADQWASNTLSAVSQPETAHPVSDSTTAIPADALTSHSTASTPGPSVPGAYPGLSNYIPSAETVQIDAEKVKDAAVMAAGTAGYALGTAGQYVAAAGAAVYPYVNAAGQTIYNAAQAAAGAAQPYVSAAGETTAHGANVASEKAFEAGQAAAETTRSGANVAAEKAAAAPGAASQGVASGAQNAGQTAAAATGKVYDGVETVGDNVAHYLPETLAKAIPHHTELVPTAGTGVTAKDTSSPHTTAVTDPTGNMNNGLEGAQGAGLAKLPEERKQEALPSHDSEHSKLSAVGVGALPGSQSEEGVARLPAEKDLKHTSGFNPTAPIPATQAFNASYLNPNITMAPEQPKASTHTPVSSTTRSGADEDASMKTLPGSILTGVGSTPNTVGSAVSHQEPHYEASNAVKDQYRGTMENKPLHEELRGKEDPHLETLREHDSAAGKGHKTSPKDTIIESVKDKETKFHSGIENGLGNGANKPLNEEGRNYTSKTTAGPPVPEKNAEHHVSPVGSGTRGDSTTATSGHESTSRTAPTTTATHSTSPNTSAQGRTGSAGSAASGHKKAGFMSKVKGEMKVVAGKMSGNEQKVEEGKRIMGKN
ncbi:hypothetical protein D9611_012422 [Ephemerocybe angulata]|uniref:Uncharacterized protein n=1 Tax=Ephemerocybe angulata TaxID=980116 RepID=A0A8H5CDY0_9AGAR|nr:hypothetical protein D9611_012422 [Tulosesus angulatus]